MAFTSNYVWPQEGLNFLLGIMPIGSGSLTNTFMGLFTTPWSAIQAYGANTNITLNSGTYPVTELAMISGSGYLRSVLSGTGWGPQSAGVTSIGASTINVQQTTYRAPQVLTCTSGTWQNVAGIFLATTSGVGSISNQNTTVLFYAPFADLGTVTLASGDSLSITPTWQSAPYPA